jgi:hypothetical protein
MIATTLVRDHDEIDQMLAVMVDAATPIDELPQLLDALQRALAMHTEVEATVFERLPAARSFAIRVQLDHADATDAIAALARVPAGTAAWYELALELRELVRDHAGGILRLLSQVDQIGNDYTDERERVLGGGSLKAAAIALRTARTGS